jgi:sugar phosphate isomerase/epimerase
MEPVPTWKAFNKNTGGIYMKQVFITTSSFGTDNVIHSGQEFYLPIISKCGACGVEIRKELFSKGHNSIENLSQCIKENKLISIYSVPNSIWNDRGELNREIILDAVGETKEIGALIVKFSLGNYIPDVSDIKALKGLIEEVELKKHNIVFTVENDQTCEGGKIERLLYFFNRCKSQDIDIKMTFDTGNWEFTGEDAFKAAQTFRNNVVYIHFKHVVVNKDGKLITVPLPNEGNDYWKKLLKMLPVNAKRAIEFPLGGKNLEKYIKKYVQLISNE